MPKAKGRVLITGGGGMIAGKQIIRRLLSTDTPITVYDTIFFPDELEILQQDFPNGDLKVVIGDVRDHATLSNAMTPDITGCIHLAAVSRVLWCLENERDCEDVNVRGTKAVLEAFKGDWFIQASSREVYGSATSFPVVEDTPHNPANVYGASKALAEDVIQRHVSDRQETGPLHVILLRFSNVYGSPADHRERLIPAIMTNALANRPIQIVGGDQDLDMVNIHDVVDAVSLAVNRLEERSSSPQSDKTSDIETFNIGTSASTSAMELLRKIFAITNSSSPLQTIPGDARFPDRYVGSTVKSSEVLGYKARVTMDEGLHRLAIEYLGETIDYLEQKLENECTDGGGYSVADLLELDGCTGTLAANVDDQPLYAYRVDAEEGALPTYGWRDEDEPTSWQFRVQPSQGKAAIRFARRLEDGSTDYYEALEDGRLLGSQSDFLADVDPISGYISLAFASSGAPLNPSHGAKVKGNEFRFRVTPFCCPGKPAPWPFFREDPLASAISDQRRETVRHFNASQRATLCQRLQDARDVAQHKLARLESYSRPIVLEQAPLPTGAPFEWRMRNLDACTNLCDHPTVCVDTGKCACAQAACVPRPRFPFGSHANLPDLSYPSPKIDWNAITGHDPDVLVDQVSKSSWLNVLRPGARRYLSRFPDFPIVNLTKLPDDVQTHRDHDPDEYDRLQTAWHGCFSADSVMERGIKLLSQEYTDQSLVFMPYYPMTLNVNEWAMNALEHHLPADFDKTRMIVPFTFDWGRCNTVLHNLYRVRDWSQPPPLLDQISSWQPMGDLNSPCYYMDQDVVIPARTCLQDKLRETFGDMSRVRPSRQRSVLATFKGRLNGAGSSVREKVMCERPYKHIEPKLVGANSLSVYWDRMKPGADYLETIGDTVFCPLPRGTTGWATRTIDVIYAGCIPVLIGDQTHHPFWDMLDWPKFSVQIDDDELDHLESVLLQRYTWEDVQRMQTNLMLVRDAFLYPTEGDMEANLSDRGPFFFALHGTALYRMTRYPT
ncbi:hypothetical protein BCR39DRAFT_578143 [Naematelia encephala]|uniref:Exostosin GT47 domain-containing protein n=1 Tax=Naematelia encephala TaxID=71784 RepID=A0A1Y2AWY2_9TREE|nr:hypothetical protein BCR39DRAFT_578143 [Naematelia encephala]